MSLCSIFFIFYKLQRLKTIKVFFFVCMWGFTFVQQQLTNTKYVRVGIYTTPGFYNVFISVAFFHNCFFVPFTLCDVSGCCFALMSCGCMQFLSYVRVFWIPNEMTITPNNTIIHNNNTNEFQWDKSLWKWVEYQCVCVCMIVCTCRYF